jgi:hypothetical protein
VNACVIATFVALAPDTTEAQLRSAYRKWDEAYFVRGVKTLASLLDPSFTLVTGHGKIVSRTEYVARLWKSDLPNAYETKVIRLIVGESQATAWTLERTQKAGTAWMEHRYKDSWKLSQGRWKLVRSQTIGER